MLGIQNKESKLAIEKFSAALDMAGQDDGSITLQGHWSLLYESLGRFSLAAVHKANEIAKIDELFKLGDPLGFVDDDLLLHELKKLKELSIAADDSQGAQRAANRIDDIEKARFSHKSK